MGSRTTKQRRRSPTGSASSSTSSAPPAALEENLIDWSAPLDPEDEALESKPAPALSAKAKKKARKAARAAEEAAAAAAASDDDVASECEADEAHPTDAPSAQSRAACAFTSCIGAWSEDIHIVASVLVVASYIAGS